MDNEPRKPSRRSQGLPPQIEVPCPKTVYLPCELKAAVLAQLEKRDLKSVRLVSKEWNAVATEPLFDRVYISCWAQDMEAFKNITSHPVISASVRELVHDVSLFQKKMRFKDYVDGITQNVDFMKKLSRPDAPLDSADVQMNEFYRYCERRNIVTGRLYKRHKKDRFLVEGYQKYRDFSAFESHYSESGGFFDDVCRGLASLNNLRSVVHGHSFWDHALYGNHFFKTPNSNNLHGTSSGSPLSRVWNPFHLRPEGWRRLIDVEYGRSQIGVRFHTLTRAICATGKKISSLQISDSPSGEGLPLQALTAPNLTYGDYRHLMTAYSGLRCLDILITTDEVNYRYPLTVLSELLDRTCGLRRLSLHFYKSNSRPLLYKIPFDEMFPAHSSWPGLTELSLSGLAIGGRDLMLLLIRHARLRRLRLCGIDLPDGTWEAVVEGMRRLPRLTELTLKNALTHCGGTNFIPRRPGCQCPDRRFVLMIQSYVARGGRHPSLTGEQDSHTATRWYHDMMPWIAHEDVDSILARLAWNKGIIDSVHGYHRT